MREPCCCGEVVPCCGLVAVKGGQYERCVFGELVRRVGWLKGKGCGGAGESVVELGNKVVGYVLLFFPDGN